MAIAFDNVQQVAFQNSLNTETTSHTVTGLHPIGLLFIENEDTTGISGTPTWNGSNMTLLTSVASGSTLYVYYIVNPTTGTVSVTRNTTAAFWSISTITYSGASQGAPEASNTGHGASGSPITASVTTIANNAWTVLNTHNNGGSMSAGTGTTLRGSVLSDVTLVGDSNAGLSPGSNSMNFNNAGAYQWIIVSLAPFLVSNVSVSETSAASETVKMQEVSMVNKSDSLSLLESVFLSIRNVLSIAESILVSDAVAMVKDNWSNSAKDSSSWSAPTRASSLWTDKTQDASTFVNQHRS